MNRYSQLFHALEKDPEDSRMLHEYFAEVDCVEGAWVAWLLSGKRMKRVVQWEELKDIVSGATGLPRWLVEESHSKVGNWAETAALLVQDLAQGDGNLSLETWINQWIQPLKAANFDQKSKLLRETWRQLHPGELVPFQHLLMGHIGLYMEPGLLATVLAGEGNLPPAIIAHRISKEWHPVRDGMHSILAPMGDHEQGLVPKPFVEHFPDTPSTQEMKNWQEWEILWNEGGERAQILKSGGEVLMWSIHKRTMHIQCPMIIESAARLPDGVCLEGSWCGDQEFSVIHVHSPEGFTFPEIPRIHMAERIRASSWGDVVTLHKQGWVPGMDGFLLKKGNQGFWLDFAPRVAYMVLVGAKPGNTEALDVYSLAAKDGNGLAVVAESQGDLTPDEMEIINGHIRDKTTGKYGPLRTVEAELVFKVEFMGVREAPRRKAGISLVFGGPVALEPGKGLEDVVSVEDLRKWLPPKPKGLPEQGELDFEGT